MNERAHVEYFDWLRIIAALSVIFMHTAAGPLRAGINTGWHLLNVCTSLAFTAVPLFFMMSGYLLMTSGKRPTFPCCCATGCRGWSCRSRAGRS